MGGLLVLACVALTGWPQYASGQTPTAPDPGGREDALVKLPPPGPTYFGLHDTGIVGGSPHGWSPAQIARYSKTAGAELMRVTIDWRLVEPSRNVWHEGNWAGYKLAYDAIVGAGMQPFIGVSTAPQWARDVGLPMLCGGGRGCEYPPSRAMLGEWQEFLVEIARRFPKTAAIEIWNEPNIYNFWKPQPQPERYAELVASAYDAIKAVNPRIQVLAGALAAAQKTFTDGFGNVSMGMTEFLTAAYNASPSIAGHMDGLSFHQASQAIRYGKNSALALAFQAVRQARRALDRRQTPLWLTEFSLSTSENDHVTPAVQADGLLRAYRKIVTMPDVEGLLFHTLGDRIELGRNDPEFGVGMISGFQPFSPKPAYCAFAGRASANPPAPCRRIKEGRVSRCTVRLVNSRAAIGKARGARKKTLAKRHQRLTRRCVPYARRTGNVSGKLPRCMRKLTRLQRQHAKVIETLRFDVLNQHERVRRRCR